MSTTATRPTVVEGVLDLRSPMSVYDNPVLLAVLRTRDRAATAAALGTGTVVLAQLTGACGQRTVALCTDVQGRRTACGFSAMAVFADWARRSGHRGGYRVVAGTDLAEQLAADGVEGLVLDAGAAHTASVEVSSLAGSPT